MFNTFRTSANFNGFCWVMWINPAASNKDQLFKLLMVAIVINRC